MLPLLREQEGSGGQSQTSTAEERVIGAGLQALERNKDGAAVKELFHMFAVTQVSIRSYNHGQWIIVLNCFYVFRRTLGIQLR